MWTRPVAIATILAAAAFIAAGCAAGEGSESSAAAPTTALPPWNYPPAEYRSEIAIPLDEATADAARFAMQYRIDRPRALDDRDGATSILSRVSPEEALPDWYHPTGTPNPATGGELYKTVGAKVIDDQGTIEFTLCEYFTPGLYYRDRDTGGLFAGSNHLLYTLWSPRVRFTTENAADGRTTTEPRWLVVGHGKQLLTPSERDLKDQACRPYMPEPFVQITPTPR